MCVCVNGFIWVRIGAMEDSCECSNKLSGPIICRIMMMMMIMMTTTTTTHTVQINDNTVTAEISVLSYKGLRWIRPIFIYAERVYPAVFY